MAEADCTSPGYWRPIIGDRTGSAAWDKVYAHALQLVRDDPETALPDFLQMKNIFSKDGGEGGERSQMETCEDDLIVLWESIRCRERESYDYWECDEDSDEISDGEWERRYLERDCDWESDSHCDENEIVNVFKRSLRTDALTERSAIGSVTWTLCVVDGHEGELMKEENAGGGGPHAEEILLSKLQTRSFSRLEIYLSTSPCKYCCEYIMDFYTKKRIQNPDLTIHIICSSLYKLYDREERRGLSKLCNTSGIGVRTFAERDWSTLNRWKEWELLDIEEENVPTMSEEFRDIFFHPWT